MASRRTVQSKPRRTKRLTIDSLVDKLTEVQARKPELFSLPDSRVREALDVVDRCLLMIIAGTVGRDGSGYDAHNLAVAAKASTDLRSMLLLGGDA